MYLVFTPATCLHSTPINSYDRNYCDTMTILTSKVSISKSKHVLDKNVLNETILRKSPGDANIQIQS